MNLREEESVEGRRKKLEKIIKIQLPNTGSFTLDAAVASKRNCENMIGVTQIPVGIAGPLKILGFKENVYVPLATTEGALVASVSRGCKAITESGGAGVSVEKVGATRGPVFRIKNISEGIKLNNFLNKNFRDLQKVAAKASDHLRLIGLKGQTVGKYYFCRFNFDTDEAMGMNMVTIATGAIAGFIKSKTGITCLSLSGNYCIDKKASWLNFTEGRGCKINAEVVLKEKVVKEVLKTSPKKIYDVWLGKCMTGSALAGSMGFNAQFANVVAAFFLATGQDAAHVVEGSLGITSMEVVNKDLSVSIYLPDVMMGTIGGGTGLATQKEALSIIGTRKIAEVLGAAVLAGEISLLGSLAEGSLVRAHETLARGKKK